MKTCKTLEDLVEDIKAKMHANIAKGSSHPSADGGQVPRLCEELL